MRMIPQRQSRLLRTVARPEPNPAGGAVFCSRLDGFFSIRNTPSSPGGFFDFPRPTVPFLPGGETVPGWTSGLCRIQVDVHISFGRKMSGRSFSNTGHVADVSYCG